MPAPEWSPTEAGGRGRIRRSGDRTIIRGACQSVTRCAWNDARFNSPILKLHETRWAPETTRRDDHPGATMLESCMRLQEGSTLGSSPPKPISFPES